MAETHAEYMARRKAELSSGRSTYGTGAVGQSTVNPQPAANVAGAESWGSGPALQTTSGIDTGPTAQDIAYQQEEQAKSNARGTISSLIDQAIGVYDTLYGNVRGAAADQRSRLEGRYNTETGQLTRQFNEELPGVGRQYAGRGLGDSSYRRDAEQSATNQFNDQIYGIGKQYEDDRAKIGAELVAQEASFGVDKNLLEQTRARLGQVTDLNELLSTQDLINRKIAELQGQTQTTGTQASYLNRFNQIAGAGDRLAGLQATLTNIIQGAAPAPLKRAVAQQIIGSSGLSEEEKLQLGNQINTQIG